MTTQVYALIKKSSKYHWNQHTDGVHFPVTFVPDGITGRHIVLGNSNRYQVIDLSLYVQLNERFIKIKG